MTTAEITDLIANSRANGERAKELLRESFGGEIARIDRQLVTLAACARERLNDGDAYLDLHLISEGLRSRRAELQATLAEVG